MNDRSGKELDGLLIKLTTNHTYFMREPEHFTYLTSTVLPFIKQTNAKAKQCVYGAQAVQAEKKRTLRLCT